MSALWNRNISIIHCFGDSLTEGYGVLPGQGWVALADKELKGISLYNHGLSGSMAVDILDSLSGASGPNREARRDCPLQQQGIYGIVRRTCQVLFR